MFKFIFGPTLGYAAGYSLITTVIITISGMMLSVYLFTYLGEFIRNKWLASFFSKRKKFSTKSRQFVKIWKRYGERGVAFLTPLLLTPIGGTLILTGNKTHKGKIISLMWISAVFWSFVISSLVYFFGDAFLKLLP